MSVEVTVSAAPPEGWDALARRLGHFYHDPAWILGLTRTLRYQVHWLAAREGGALRGALALAEVPGLLGPRRLVSFPFSFIAGPLAEEEAVAQALADGARDLAGRLGCRRVELRRLGTETPPPAGFERSLRYSTYRIRTDDGEAALWKRLHRTSTQQRIKKAEKAGVEVVEGRTEADWLAMARLEEEVQRGHGAPPPPRAIFLSLCRELQGAGLADLYLARVPGGEVAAGFVMFKGAREWIYAYSAAADRYVNTYRPTHLLLWRGLQRAAALGVTVDLGRTAEEQVSLAEFKERWGSERVPLAYDYWPGVAGLTAARRDAGSLALAGRVWRRLPRPLARMGSVLYRYLG
ncbi:MAG TPA: GNAT family N-acetyltransferase [Gemmatimonadales bacterium]|nr:GNAT family N-acetyltransferase [Gemmatimonadales bacterium]